MSAKVKRGLGLLAVAVLAWVVAAFVVSLTPGGGLGGTLLQLVELVAYTAAAVGLVGGLVLIAWGLLAD